MATRRARDLEFAILGLLRQAPLHGYELRKRLDLLLGPLRAVSYGSLYPSLRSLQARGLIRESEPAPQGRRSRSAATSRPVGLGSRRSRIEYAITDAGTARFVELASAAGPDAWADDAFVTHMAFFGHTPRPVRLRILEGRRSRVEERLALLRTRIEQAEHRTDSYVLLLQQYRVETLEREVRWLTDLLDREREPAG